MGKDKSKHLKRAAEGAPDAAGPGPSSMAMQGPSHPGSSHKRVRLQVVKRPASEMPATACYFPAGQPPKGADYALYEASTYTGRPSFTLVGHKGNINFVGRTHGDEYTGVSQSCTQLLGVYDKTTGVVQLLPLAAGRIMRMEPRLPGLQYDVDIDALEEARDEQSTREQTLADNKKLVDSFGSTRRRRQLNAREEGQVRVDKLGDAAEALAAVVDKLAADAVAQGLTKKQVLEQANTFRHLPPHHLDAHTPEAAYPIAELIPPEVSPGLRVGQLFKAAEDSAAAQDMLGKNVLNEYVVSRLQLVRDDDKSAAKTRARLLTFLSLLMKLKSDRFSLTVDMDKGGAGGITRAASSLRTTPEVLEPVLNMFYTSTSDGSLVKYARSKAGDSLLMAYICVVSLRAERGCHLAAEHIGIMARCLKMSITDLVQHFREVGAVCKSVNVKSEAGDGKARSFTAALLPDPTKTLKDCLPGVKMLTNKKR